MQAFQPFVGGAVGDSLWSPPPHPTIPEPPMDLSTFTRVKTVPVASQNHANHRFLQQDGDIVVVASFTGMCVNSAFRKEVLFGYTDYEEGKDVWCGCDFLNRRITCYLLSSDTTCPDDTFASCACGADNCAESEEIFYFSTTSNLLSAKAHCSNCFSSTTCDDHRRICAVVDFDDNAHEARSCTFQESFGNGTVDICEECDLCTNLISVATDGDPVLEDGMNYNCFDSFVTSNGNCDASNSVLVHNMVFEGGTFPPGQAPAPIGPFQEACNDFALLKTVDQAAFAGVDGALQCDCIEEGFRINCKLPQGGGCDVNTETFTASGEPCTVLEIGYRFRLEDGILFQKETCVNSPDPNDYYERCVDVNFNRAGDASRCQLEQLELDGSVRTCNSCSICVDELQGTAVGLGVSFNCFNDTAQSNGCETRADAAYYGYAEFPPALIPPPTFAPTPAPPTSSPPIGIPELPSNNPANNENRRSLAPWAIVVVTMSGVVAAALVVILVHSHRRRRSTTTSAADPLDGQTVLSDLDLQEEQQEMEGGGGAGEPVAVAIPEGSVTNVEENENASGIMT